MAAPTSAKRAKLQKTIGCFFNLSQRSARRLICKGSHHQGELASGGSQCVCIAVTCLCAENIPTSTPELDDLLREGTQLYSRLNVNQPGLTIEEIPSQVDILGKSYDLSFHDPRGGLLSQCTDDPGTLTFCIQTALCDGFEESPNLVVTLGNSPGASLALKKTNEHIMVFDSHSRDERGMCSPAGKAVLLEISSQTELATYISDLAQSISSDSNMPFEVTALSVTERPALTNIDTTPEYLSDITHSTSESSDQHYTHPGDKTHETVTPVISIDSDSIQPVQQQSQVNLESSFSSTHIPDAMTPSPSTSASSLSQGPSFADRVSDTCISQNQSNIHVLSANTTDNNQVDDPEGLVLDIADYTTRKAPDYIKQQLINKRQPDPSYSFPPKTYKDKRKKDGFMKRYCSKEWFDRFEFISYSKGKDGLYCLACLLFPDTAHRRPNILVNEPYRNWKDAMSDLKSHTANEYHMNSMAKLNAFKSTFSAPSRRIDMSLESSRSDRVSNNRGILKSILCCVEFCGRQGISFRGHRDDDTCVNLNKGNFKSLIEFRANAGDVTLKDHLESCAKNATYTSKVSQNDLLVCVKEFIQNHIIEEIQQQPIGPYFGYQVDEVTDSSNWEQLGIVLRYTVDNKPVERLLEFVKCDETTGEAICAEIVKSLTEAGLDIQLCRSLTMDGAGNMAGKHRGAAVRFKELSPKAIYNYCASHDLNRAICKACDVKEIHMMLDTLVELGLFFKYSPKRSRRLEQSIVEFNEHQIPLDKIPKSKFHVFCETRWVEKIKTLADFSTMYEPLLDCLDAISQKESNWDTKTVTTACGLSHKITDSTFLVCFNTTIHMLGYVSGLSVKLQGSSEDIVQANELVEHVKESVAEARNADFQHVYQQSLHMAQKAGLDDLQIPRRCGHQTQRNNVPGSTAEQYFHRAIFLPFTDCFLQELNLRFNTLTKQASLAFCLLPKHTDKLDNESRDAILDFYNHDLPQKESFRQEIQLWKCYWTSAKQKPESVHETLAVSCRKMFPNITKILNILLLSSVTSAGVERSNSSLKFIKSPHRSTMGQDRFNALMLLFVHKDIDLNYDKIIDMYARKYPRRMLLIDPLTDST